jgi:hypothetical protein
MSTQYRLVQSGKNASGGCSAGPRFVRAVAPRIIIIIIIIIILLFLRKYIRQQFSSARNTYLIPTKINTPYARPINAKLSHECQGREPWRYDAIQQSSYYGGLT